MTPLATKVRDYAINAVITTVAVGALAISTGAWAKKEDVGAHQLDLQVVHQKIESNAAMTNAKLDRLLDAVCDKATTPKPRTCAATEPWFRP